MLKYQDDSCQKLGNCIYIYQSYDWNTVAPFFPGHGVELFSRLMIQWYCFFYLLYAHVIFYIFDVKHSIFKKAMKNVLLYWYTNRIFSKVLMWLCRNVYFVPQVTSVNYLFWSMKPILPFNSVCIIELLLNAIVVRDSCINFCLSYAVLFFILFFCMMKYEYTQHCTIVFPLSVPFVFVILSCIYYN